MGEQRHTLIGLLSLKLPVEHNFPDRISNRISSPKQMLLERLLPKIVAPKPITVRE